MTPKNALITELILKNQVLIATSESARNTFLRLAYSQPNTAVDALASSRYFFLIILLQTTKPAGLVLAEFAPSAKNSPPIPS